MNEKNDTTMNPTDVQLPPAARLLDNGPSLADLQAQIAALSSAFGEERQKTKQLARQLAEVQTTNEVMASGNVPILFAHCNNCGDKVEEDDDGSVACNKHPRALVNHVGQNLTPHLGGGKYVMVKQHPGIAASVS